MNHSIAMIDAVTDVMDRQHAKEDERPSMEQTLLRKLDAFRSEFWNDISAEDLRKIIRNRMDYAEIGRIVSKAVIEPAEVCFK